MWRSRSSPISITIFPSSALSSSRIPIRRWINCLRRLWNWTLTSVICCAWVMERKPWRRRRTLAGTGEWITSCRSAWSSLSEVGRLQTSLGVHGDVAYTCETAGHFYLYQVRFPGQNVFVISIRQIWPNKFPFFRIIKNLFSKSFFSIKISGKVFMEKSLVWKNWTISVK